LSSITLNLLFSNIRTLFVAVLDILIMWLFFYYALRIVRTNSRTIQIFKGIILIVVIDMLAKIIGLKTLQFISDLFINWGFLALIIIFQPEFRSLLEKLGKTNVFARINNLTSDEKENLVNQIVTAVMLLSKDSTGALISIEQSHSLDDYVQTGTPINSDVTAELLTSIFVTSTPLHDGAVIIQGNRISCASAYFPPTNMELPSRFGARHRAAIGISELTDAVTIVVSEETGNISITENGSIFIVNREQLRDYLLRVICAQETDVTSNPLELNSDEFVVKNEEVNEKKVKTEEVVSSQPIAREPELDRIHRKADEEAEAAHIKLPHKKKRPQASYPTQKKRVIANDRQKSKGGDDHE